MIKTQSALQLARKAYQPKLPKTLRGAVEVLETGNTEPVANKEELKSLFPNTYGLPILRFV